MATIAELTAQLTAQIAEFQRAFKEAAKASEQHQTDHTIIFEVDGKELAHAVEPHIPQRKEPSNGNK